MLPNMEDTTDMICEQHPTKPWPHDYGCAGPGMPWRVGLDLFAESQRELAEAVALLRSWPASHKYGVCPSCGVSISLQNQTRAFLAKYPEAGGGNA